MKKRIYKFITSLFLLFIISGCVSAPYTNRSQFIITSEEEEIEMGNQLFNEIKQQSVIETAPAYTQVSSRVGERIANAVEGKNYDWEFIVVRSDVVNAFCLPGGKIVVYTGLFPYLDNESELACVVAHEVGHAIARHGGENISRQYMQQLGAVAISSVFSSSANHDVWLSVYGIGSNVAVMLPYSREQEYEADHIGLVLMARAGYDPRAAVTFWNKFKNLQNYGRLEEFFTTHPMGEKRVEEINKLMPEAIQHYENAQPKYGLGETLKFKSP